MRNLRSRIDVNTLAEDSTVESLGLNDIGRLTLRTAAPLVYDPYRRNRATGSLILNAVLKAAFDRPRPELWEHRGQYQWASYPSGHAIVGVSVMFTIAILLHRERGWLWPFAAATCVLILNLYSRLYLGVHWPTDIIGGLVVGSAWLLITLYAFRPVDRGGIVADAAEPGSRPDSRGMKLRSDSI